MNLATVLRYFIVMAASLGDETVMEQWLKTHTFNIFVMKKEILWLIFLLKLMVKNYIINPEGVIHFFETFTKVRIPAIPDTYS